MCTICEGTEIISRTIEISENKDMNVTIRNDEEQNDWIKVRIQLGSFGYTLPIKAHYCYICGRDLNKEVVEV